MTSAHLAAEFVHLPHKQSGKAAEFKGKKSWAANIIYFHIYFLNFHIILKKVVLTSRET